MMMKKLCLVFISILQLCDVSAGAQTNDKAKEMAKILIDNGIKAIWNFAHTDLNLKLPKDVIVENVHLSESLMRLSYNLTRYEAEHPKNN